MGKYNYQLDDLWKCVHLQDNHNKTNTIQYIHHYYKYYSVVHLKLLFCKHIFLLFILKTQFKGSITQENYSDFIKHIDSFTK